MKTITLSLFVMLFVSGCSQKGSTNGMPQFPISANDVSAASVQIVTNQADPAAAKTAVVDVQFYGKGAADLQKFTQEHLNQQVQILVGSKVVAEPRIRSVISGGTIQLTFSTPEEAQTVANSLSKR